MTTRIGGKIFDHLQMMEYYEYLKDYDESYISIFKRPIQLVLKGEGDVEPKLEVTFLIEWEKRCAIQNTESWNLKRSDSLPSGSISRSEFIHLFSGVGIQ